MNLTCIGTSHQRPSARAEVQYIPQRGDFYCAPACVLAWRLHDGLPFASQDEIFASMSGGRSSGVRRELISLGVNNYTNTHDAFLDFADGPYSDPRGRFISRQISSVQAGVPVIALARQGLHAIVIYGGSSHVDSTNGNQVWDTTEFMDPAIGLGIWFHGNLDQIDELCPNDYNTCEQVISRTASGGGNTEERGIGGPGRCADCSPSN